MEFSDMMYGLASSREGLQQSRQYLIFVDLRKVYDSAPQQTTWEALRKLGVPDLLVDIIKHIHTNLEAMVGVHGIFWR